MRHGDTRYKVGAGAGNRPLATGGFAMTNSELKKELEKIHEETLKKAAQEKAQFARLDSWADRVMENAAFDKMNAFEEIANNLAKSIKALEELGIK